MATEIIGYVCRTDDLSQFKTLEGNREAVKVRVRKIRESMKKHGYIHCPIIVNEKMEVIDGQGRLEALKELNLPVEYIEFEGLGINECIALNVSQTSWSIMDYIESFAERGNMNYRFLLHLITKYKELTAAICINAVCGTIGNNSRVTTMIKTGEFECTGEQYEKAVELLDFVMRFLKPIKNFQKGPIPYIALALMFAYQIEDVDKEKLVDKFERYYGMDDVAPFTDITGALRVLTNVYNRRNSNKVYFEIEYDKYMSGKLTWYAARWGKGNRGGKNADQE